MKRYKISRYSLDTTRNIFNLPPVGQMKDLKGKMKTFLISKYGDMNFDEKFDRYMKLDKPVISVIAEHTYILEDVCNSYVQGYRYSALTGACCLGERIFNDILFKVMDQFKPSKHYKFMHGRDSLIDWEKAVEILSDWDIIDDETKVKYKELYKLRYNSVHFQKKEQDLDIMSLSAINTVIFIINKLFSIGIHRKDILIYYEVPGELFIKKEAEKDPMVKAFFIPCCDLVGPRYKTVSGEKPGTFKIIDNEKYEDKDISDNEFVKLRKSFQKITSPNPGRKNY